MIRSKNHFIVKEGRVLYCPSNIAQMTVPEYLKYFGVKQFKQHTKDCLKTLWSSFKEFCAFPIILVLTILHFCGLSFVVQIYVAYKTIREEKKYCKSFDPNL